MNDNSSELDQGGRSGRDTPLSSSHDPAGKDGTPEEYLQRFPEFEKKLRNLFKGIRHEADSGLGAPDASGGRVIGDFRVIREIRSGGMATVYEAEQISLKRRVALKVLPPHLGLSRKATRKFRREAEAGGRQVHPGVVAVFATGEHEGIHYIAQELVEGGYTLADRLEEFRKESDVPRGYFRVAAELIAEVADALEHSHAAGVIHRDVKPSNILLTGKGRPKVTDFGLARVEDALALSRTGELMGTPYYMSPEQTMSRRTGIDHRTDIFSLGVTLYETLTLERPFDGDTSQEVLRKIVLQEPKNLSKVSPRVPRDLSVICLKALEKDPKYRYQSMRLLADDLLRYLSGEPVLARPAGSVVRVRKWMRRNPGKAVAVAAVGVILVLAAGFFMVQRIAQHRTSLDHMESAESHFRNADYIAALEAIARALEWDADSVPALELKQKILTARDRAAKEQKKKEAAAALESAGESFAKYDRLRKEMAGQWQEIQETRLACISEYATTAQRAALAGMEKRYRAREVNAEQFLLEAREAINRAARLEDPGTGKARAALKEYFFRRWVESREAGDSVREAVHHASVMKLDRNGKYKKTLLGSGTLTVGVKPPDAEVYLFRYESYDTVRQNRDVVPRLVPVPATGTGRIKKHAWVEDFHPGDLCLEVTGVAEGSIAATAGLEPGDLVIRLNGQPCGNGLFVEHLDPEGPALMAGVKVLDRIESLGGEPVEGMYDWRLAQTYARKKAEQEEHAGEVYTLVAGGIEVTTGWEEWLDQTFRLRPATATDLVQGKAPAPMKLLSLRSGEPHLIEIPEGKQSGIECKVTAYPLIPARSNRIRIGETLEASPGSYLLLARREGYEDQRYPVVVPRSGRAEAKIRLLEEGTTPPGFVYIPPGPFLYGGDAEAFPARPGKVVHLDGFFMARKELTNREWFAFVNAPEMLDTILDSSRQQRGDYLPRQSGIGFVNLEDGKFVPKYKNMDGSIFGISLKDIKEYLKWRNRKAAEAGEEWVFDLPTEQEWEKAARGVDGRIYPWGNRFDHSLTVGLYRKEEMLKTVPGGFEPRDESPHGLLDMGGSRYEWTNSEYRSKLITKTQYVYRGGALISGLNAFRLADRAAAPPNYTKTSLGLRLVVRNNPR